MIENTVSDLESLNILKFLLIYQKAIRFLEEERKYLLPVHAANGHIHNPMHLKSS